MKQVLLLVVVFRVVEKSWVFFNFISMMKVVSLPPIRNSDQELVSSIRKQSLFLFKRSDGGVREGRRGGEGERTIERPFSSVCEGGGGGG